MMKDLKLITILKTLSKDEMKRFGKFLESPYFNCDRNFKPIFSILKKYHPGFPEQKISESELFRKLYPAKKFEGKKSSLAIRVLLSQMTALAKKFVAYERFEHGGETYEINEQAADSFVERRLHKLALEIQLMNSAALDAGARDHDYFHRRFITNRWLTHLSYITQRNEDHFRHERNNLLYLYADIFEMLASYLHDAALKLYNSDLSFGGFEVAKSLIAAFDPVIFDRDCRGDVSETKDITLFNYYILKSRLDDADSKSPFKAMEYFYKFFPSVPWNFQFNCFARLHHVFKERQRFDRIYLVKLNELVDFAWGAGVCVYSNGFLDMYGYNMVLKIKLYLLCSSEIRKFIETYVEKIAPKFREDIRNLSLAFLCFKDKFFGKCLEYASKRDNLGPIFRIDKYRLMFCSFFEGGLYEEAIYSADALDRYLKRNKKEIGTLVSGTANFLKGFRYLLDLESGKATIDEVKVAKTLEMHKFTILGEWLEEKLMKYQTQKGIKLRA